MALKLSETFKGITADYRKITDCNVVTGQVCMALFADKERAKNRENMLGGRESFNIDFDVKEMNKEGTNPLNYAYGKIKESKLSIWEEGTRDEKGELVLEKDFIRVETNKYALAEDILEATKIEEK